MAEHYCEEHQTEWFKRGKMRNYAHPITDKEGNQLYSGEGKPLWCSEPEAEPSPQPLQSVSSPIKAETPQVRVRDDATRVSIERQKALDISKDWAIALLESGKKDLSGTSIIQLAKAFENYLNTGNVPDSPLVKEVQKLDKKEP